MPLSKQPDIIIKSIAKPASKHHKLALLIRKTRINRILEIGMYLGN